MNAFFDLSFSKFVSTSVVGMLYGLGILLGPILIFYNAEYLFSFGTLGGLILPAITSLVFVVCWRVACETSVALIRIAENTTTLVEMEESKEA